MKWICTVAFFCFVAFSAEAQLANTKWSGVLNVESGVPVTMSFSADSLEVFAEEDGSLVEVMKYTYADDVLTLQKLSGQSQCDVSTEAKYKFSLNGYIRTFEAVSDDCRERKGAIDKVPMKKMD